MVEKDYEWEIQYRDEQIKELRETLAGTIRENGHLEYVIGENGAYHKWSINTSFILTKLIQEAGKWCEYHASDLFIFWSSIEEKLKNGTLESGEYVFAMTKDGVDHRTYYILHEKKMNYYRAVWFLDVKVSEDGRNMEMVLHK